MSKTLVAHEQAISKIFSDDYVFLIPGYQRPYAWTTEQAGELFDDLAGFMQVDGGDVEDMSPYFLGSVVLIKDESSPRADVVDGQQRLTTLTLLLAAIRSCVGEQDAGEITPLLYERGSSIRGTKDRFRLTLRDRDREFFKKYVQREKGISDLLALSDKLPDSQRNIQENARLFLSKLEAISQEDRLRLAQFIVTRCYLVVVSTPDIDAAYRIFSVLNSRGLDLSATDILKAQIIGTIHDSQKSAYTKKWEDAEENLGRDTFGELFSHIRMIFRKSKPKGTLLKEFKEHVTQVSMPMVFIDDVLLPMARAYEELLSESYESTLCEDEINEYLRWLNRLEFKDWVPPALAFSIRHRQNPELMAKFFRDVERLAYFMLVTRSGVNERIERFSKLTSAVESGVDLFCEESILQLSSIEQHTLYHKLDGPIYDSLSARARSALLLRIDALLSGGGATYEYEVVTVEHVLPQSPRQGSKWLDWFPDVRERVMWVHRLGNLALLTRRKNSSASNYDFDEKKRAYFSRNGISPFVMTTQVLGRIEWTPAVLEGRQAQLISVLEKHWRLEARQSVLESLGL